MNEAGAATPTQANGVQDFTSSELFERTFQEGMELVEETAAYLDGRAVRIPSCCPAAPPWPMPARACA